MNKCINCKSEILTGLFCCVDCREEDNRKMHHLVPRALLYQPKSGHISKNHTKDYGELVEKQYQG